MRTMMLRGVLDRCLSSRTLDFHRVRADAMSAAQSSMRENKPVEGAVIVFEQKGRKNKRDTKTDKKGEFFFVGLASGEYTVTASKDGSDRLASRRNIIGRRRSRCSSFQLKAATGTTVQTDGRHRSRSGGAGAWPARAPKDKNDVAELQATGNGCARSREGQSARRSDHQAERSDLARCRPAPTATCISACRCSRRRSSPRRKRRSRSPSSCSPPVEGYTMLVRYLQLAEAVRPGCRACQQEGERAVSAAAAGGAGAAAAAARSGAHRRPRGSATAAADANSETLYNQGVVLWNANKYAEAKPQFEAAVKANPKNADAQYMLGMASLNLGQIAAGAYGVSDVP